MGRESDAMKIVEAEISNLEECSERLRHVAEQLGGHYALRIRMVATNLTSCAQTLNSILHCLEAERIHVRHMSLTK